MCFGGPSIDQSPAPTLEPRPIKDEQALAESAAARRRREAQRRGRQSLRIDPATQTPQITPSGDSLQIPV